MKLLMTAAFLTFFATEALSANSTYGLGMGTCAVFTQSYAMAPGPTETNYFTWAQGYISGLNAQAVANGRTWRDLSIGSTDQYKTSIRNYCNGHPLVQFLDAVTVLYETLPEGQ